MKNDKPIPGARSASCFPEQCLSLCDETRIVARVNRADGIAVARPSRTINTATRNHGDPPSRMAAETASRRRVRFDCPQATSRRSGIRKAYFVRDRLPVNFPFSCPTSCKRTLWRNRTVCRVLRVYRTKKKSDRDEQYLHGLSSELRVSKIGRQCGTLCASRFSVLTCSFISLVLYRMGDTPSQGTISRCR
jgi:hypothetical protein